LRTVDIVIWVLFIIALIFLGWFFKKRMQKEKETRLKMQAEYDKKKETYKFLREGILDECPREDLSAAALFHCLRKEEEDFDHYFENFNDSEKTVHGIYQVTLSLQGKNPSLHSFFLSPSNSSYIPIIDDIFNQVGAYELADLMKAARRFAEIIENDEEDDDDDPDMGDYARYNFSDFTNEFLTLVSTTNLNEKIIQFVCDHKNDFYDDDNVEENKEGDEENEKSGNEI